MYNEVIYLVSTSSESTKDEYGDDVQTEEPRAVFALVKSIGMKEFYQAQTVGLKPEITFEIPDYLEYNREKIVIHNDIRYKVLRTYRKGIPLEIVCYGGVRNVGTTISNQNN